MSVDQTITRAHIEKVQAERKKKGETPLLPEEVCDRFIRMWEPRHLARARCLMAPKSQGG